MVIYNGAVSTHISGTALTEEVDWLKFMKRTKVGSVTFCVTDEVYELYYTMICWKFPYAVLGRDKVRTTRGADDRHSSRKFTVRRREARPVFSLFLKNEKDALKTERVVAVEEFGRTYDVVIQLPTDQTFKEGLDKTLLVHQDTPVVLQQLTLLLKVKLCP